jgi:hypothetical protein
VNLKGKMDDVAPGGRYISGDNRNFSIAAACHDEKGFNGKHF